ncbi:SlyX family protein [Tateyamaria sp. SN3-11]|uniref:SlyX family protein n=1 Tax=Tateyamaria sp. SN3-11 TaxID=3092147 RepID=UPI0039EAB4C9
MDVMNTRIETLEEQVAHLTRTVEDLSDIVARQERELALLTRRAQMLMEREAERESQGGGVVVVGDERPPHY